MKLNRILLGRSLASALLVTLWMAVGSCGTATPITGEAPAQLSDLSIAPYGQLQPPFSTATTSYAATVPTDLPSLAVTAESDTVDATISINGLMVPAGARQSVSLGAPGVPTPIEIVVLSANGEATTYVLTVTREAKCTPKPGEECCQGDYQERECGIGNCGKQSRVCASGGKWEEWSGCGVNSARTGQVCRGKANVCDPVEVCGAAADCPADYIEYPAAPGYAGYAACWQNVTSPIIEATSVQPRQCYTRPDHAHCLTGHEPTADRVCQVAGYKAYKRGPNGIVNSQVPGVDDQIGLTYWTGSSYAESAGGGGIAMRFVTCLK